jgi:catalase
LFDAIYIPGGDASVETLLRQPEAAEFVREAYKHCKAIAASDAGAQLLGSALGVQFTDDASKKSVMSSLGVVTSRGASVNSLAKAFIEAIARHRHWERENSEE